MTRQSKINDDQTDDQQFITYDVNDNNVNGILGIGIQKSERIEVGRIVCVESVGNKASRSCWTLLDEQARSRQIEFNLELDGCESIYR